MSSPLPIGLLEVGSRVWTATGFPDHGPVYGSKVSIPANIGGRITAIEQVYNLDVHLYSVCWDDGTVSKHYFKDILSLSPFSTFSELEAAIASGAPNAELVLGPQGGFRSLKITFEWQGSPCLLELGTERARIWNTIVEPLLERLHVQPVIVRLPAKRSGRPPRAS